MKQSYETQFKDTDIPQSKDDWKKIVNSSKRSVDTSAHGFILAGDLYERLLVLRKALVKRNAEIVTLEKELTKVSEEAAKGEVLTPTSLQRMLNKMEISPTDMQDTVKAELELIMPTMVAEITSQVTAALVHAKIVPGSGMNSQPPKDETRHQLILEAKEEDGQPITENEWTSVVQGKLKQQLDHQQVMGTYYKAKDNTPVLTFQSANARDEAAVTIGTEFKVEKKSEPPKKVQPKVKIVGIEKDMLKLPDDDLIAELRARNPVLNTFTTIEVSGNQEKVQDEVKIVYKKQDAGVLVIKLQRKAREALKTTQKDKVFMGFQYLNAYDHVHVDQCFDCQGFGHFQGSDFCTSKGGAPKCFYCAGNHKSKECTKKTAQHHQCVNCIAEKRTLTKHRANDPLCPSMIRETSKMFDRVDGIDPASKDHYFRMINKQRERRPLA